MVHHPLIIVPKLIALLIIAVVLMILHGVLTPEQFTVAVAASVVGFIAFCVALWTFVIRKLRNPESKISKATVLSHQARSEDGFTAAADQFTSLVGRQGAAASALSPSGIAVIEGQRISVITSGEFIAAGSAVEVVEARGARVVVQRIAEPKERRDPGDL